MIQDRRHFWSEQAGGASVVPKCASEVKTKTKKTTTGILKISQHKTSNRSLTKSFEFYICHPNKYLEYSVLKMKGTDRKNEKKVQRIILQEQEIHK